MLATLDDVQARMGRELTDDEAVRAEALLTDVSAAIATYTGQSFDRDERTRTFWGDGTTQTFTLYGKDIASVSAEDENTEAVTVTRVGLNAWSAFWSGLLTVTYTEGWTLVPDDIVAIASQVVGRSLGVHLESTGLTQESAGPFSRSFGSVSSAGGVGFLPAEQAILDRYRIARAPRTIRVSSWA